MSKKQIQNGIGTLAALSKDIAGNILSGNDVRAVGFVKALNTVAVALQELMEAGSDVRAEQKYTAAFRAAMEQLDAEHAKVPFSHDKIDESFKRYAEAGYDLSHFSAPIPA